MLFNSYSFFLFLLVTLAVSAALRKFSKKAELWFLVIASAFFYGQWSWHYLVLIYVTITTDYFLGLKYLKAQHPQRYLMISLWVNLGILAVFKYLNFFIDSGNQLFQATGLNFHLEFVELLLPVGISFYTFQSLSYTIDLHRQSLQPRRRFVDYALFVSFFPQLVAGPIVRASEFFEQLDKKRHFSFDMAQAGVMLIMIGLVKKVVFADNLALMVDPVFENPAAYSGLKTLMAVYAFAFQIYFDFSGYTDIAIGVAKLLGFNFPRNFMHPYIALSFQDFWRRWHMTLSRWLRDYLYISLGGNKRGQIKTMRNLFITMFLGGLWHGASWNFAIWGMLHGLFLAIERFNARFKLMVLDLNQWGWRLCKWLLVFHLVCLAWIFFRAESFSDSTLIIQNILFMDGDYLPTEKEWVRIMVILSLPFLHWLGSKVDLTQRAGTLSSASYIGIMTILASMLVLFNSKQSDAFMYFQF